MAQEQEFVRYSLRLDTDTHERLKYWSKRNGVTINQYIQDAIDRQIRYENGDYDLPTAEQQRVNQLIASQNATTATLESLQITVMNGFDALIGLTRGDNYLMSEESGEIDE